MGPPSGLPGRRGFKKQQSRVTVVTSNVQATPSVLGKELPRLLVKRCTAAYCTPVIMRLQGGRGGDEGTPSALAAFAQRLKAPFHDLTKRKTETLQVGLWEIAGALKEKGKDRGIVSV
jgi:hypothetical protein